jgi:excisionase family DNA binding protein
MHDATPQYSREGDRKVLESFDTLLTIEQVAKELQKSTKTVREWLRTRRLKGVKVGGTWRVRWIDVRLFMRTPSRRAKVVKQFALRLPDDLHAALVQRAKQEDRSLHWVLLLALRQFVESKEEGA